jgi:DNA-binding GntR family transcriptional regulator
VPSSWSEISKTTLADRVYVSLRDGLLRGQPGPGEFIREKDVGKALGVSRTPVRAALVELAHQGFVERMARRGFRVPAEPVQHLLALYPIVCALELLAAELAFPHLSPADIAELREVNRKMVEALEQTRWDASIELNDTFHHMLSQHSGNEPLCELLDGLRGKVIRLERWSASNAELTSQALRQHDRILDAIEAGQHQEALTMLKVNRMQTYTAFNEQVTRPSDAEVVTTDVVMPAAPAWPSARAMAAARSHNT